MNFLEAYKSGKPFKRKNEPYKKHFCNVLTEAKRIQYFDGSESFTMLSIEDILAEDWEVKENQVSLTYSQFLNAVAEVMGDIAKEKRHTFNGPYGGGRTTPYDVHAFEGWLELAEKLGFKP